MIKPLIMAGSINRPSLPLLKWISDPVILVEPQQLETYKREHPEIEYVVLPEGGRGFSYMMNQMVAEAMKRKQRYFIFTDDDVYGLKNRNGMVKKWDRLKDGATRKALQEAVEYAQSNDLAQLSISFAGASWGAKKALDSHAGAWGVYICDSWAIKSVGGFDETLWIFSDWEMSARLIKNGYKCCRTNLITFEHKMRGMEGGADFLYKNKEKVTKACHQIASRYGDSVRIKWVETHGQHEIRFNWKSLKP